MMSTDKQNSLPIFNKVLKLPIIERLTGYRFIKFAIVGSSGTIINIVMLFINQEIIFKDLNPYETRLKLSLAIAIFIATVNNYIWNRLWTWKDRKRRQWQGFFIQMAQYFLSCSFAIAVQYIITIMFSKFMNYMLANMISIVISAILVYLINDLWTFAKRNLT